MRSVEEIENQIRGLPRADLAKLREWFLEQDAQAWDAQFESDVRAGKLDENQRKDSEGRGKPESHETAQWIIVVIGIAAGLAAIYYFVTQFFSPRAISGQPLRILGSAALFLPARRRRDPLPRNSAERLS